MLAVSTIPELNPEHYAKVGPTCQESPCAPLFLAMRMWTSFNCLTSPCRKLPAVQEERRKLIWRPSPSTSTWQSKMPARPWTYLEQAWKKYAGSMDLSVGLTARCAEQMKASVWKVTEVSNNSKNWILTASCLFVLPFPLPPMLSLSQT